ncbi:hypothetical protein SDC9_89607 [bioreactor metagenome]|uniref:Uncharacterized protein n=1 Tax=bioreactor metagenome TaxID=1076179 RepID=A0A644ZPX0_9ZZZZ
MGRPRRIGRIRGTAGGGAPTGEVIPRVCKEVRGNDVGASDFQRRGAGRTTGVRSAVAVVGQGVARRRKIDNDFVIHINLVNLELIAGILNRIHKYAVVVHTDNVITVSHVPMDEMGVRVFRICSVAVIIGNAFRRVYDYRNGVVSNSFPDGIQRRGRTRLACAQQDGCAF